MAADVWAWEDLLINRKATLPYVMVSFPFCRLTPQLYNNLN